VMFSIHTVHADAGAYGEAERQSSRALRRLAGSGWRVVDDVPFGPMNIDHVAIGPRGVVAVESASISSPYPVDEDGGDALETALRHAKRGARRVRLLLKSQGIDAHVAPALALWGRGSASLATQTVDGVSMLVGRDSKQWSDQLPSTGERFEPEEVAEIEAILARFVEMRRELYRRPREDSLPA
ncbi:MAG: nuclease-related domain-containing protein, partial [Actinomycetota bacterium]